jgi:hypothetical protein
MTAQGRHRGLQVRCPVRPGRPTNSFRNRRSADDGRLAMADGNRLARLDGRAGDLDACGGVRGRSVAGRHADQQHGYRSSDRDRHDFQMGGSVGVNNRRITHHCNLSRALPNMGCHLCSVVGGHLGSNAPQCQVTFPRLRCERPPTRHDRFTASSETPKYGAGTKVRTLQNMAYYKNRLREDRA